MKLRMVTLLLVFLATAAVTSGGTTIRDWQDLPPADPQRRAALVEALVRELPGRWDPESGGLAPGYGAIPTFRYTAYGLLALVEAPDELIDELAIPRQQWLSDAVAKMLASQASDAAEADPARYPHSLYGSVIYPGWLPEAEWPLPRSRYEWDMFVPPPLLTLLARHRTRLPADVTEQLHDLLWRAADGVLHTWYAVRDLPEISDPEEYWGHSNYSLMYLQTLILAGELTGHEEARIAGVQALDRFLANLRRRGLHEYASPTYLAVDLDAVAHLAQESADGSVRYMASNLFAYLWTDLALTLTGSDEDGSLAMGGPASRTYRPLVPNGGHLVHLYVAAGNRLQPGADPVHGYRATIERRPPAAILGLADSQPRQAAACWGDDPGQDRSWWVEPGLLVGAASAVYGPQDRGLAIDLPAPAARVHLTADSYSSGGLPDSLGSERGPLFSSAVHSGRCLAAVAEAHPAGSELRVTVLLYLPAEVEQATIGDSDLQLPAEGTDEIWFPEFGEWVAVATDREWVAVTALDMAPDLLLLRCLGNRVEGARVLRLEIQAPYLQQPVMTGWALTVVPRAQAPTADDLRDLLAAVAVAYRGTPAGLELTVSGGPFPDHHELRVVHDVVNHRVVSRSPQPPVVCGIGAPLAAPELQWRGTRLQVTSAAGRVELDLAGLSGVRQVGGRQR